MVTMFQTPPRSLFHRHNRHHRHTSYTRTSLIRLPVRIWVFAGMTIAIEPMICQGDYKIKQLSDGWTVKTKDGGLAAHFEHSIAILKDRTEIMTRSWDDPDFDPATFSLK